MSSNQMYEQSTFTNCLGLTLIFYYNRYLFFLDNIFKRGYNNFPTILETLNYLIKLKITILFSGFINSSL